MQIKEIVQKRFSEPMKCYGHCEQESQVRFLSSDDDLLVSPEDKIALVALRV